MLPRALAILPGLLLAAAVIPPVVRADDFSYRPNDAALAVWTEERALDLLRQLLGTRAKTAELAAEVNAGQYSFWLDERGETVSNTSDHVKRVEVLEDRIRMVTEAATSEFPYADLPEVEAFHESPGLFDHGRTGVGLSKDRDLLVGMPTSDVAQTAAFLRKLADALHVLRRPSQGFVSPEQERHFAEVAARYRSSAVKPALPEEVRRYRVQAEFALDQRRYADAIARYGEALKIAPWWAQGRFNRALLLAEVGRHAQAIAEMRRFLVLEPGSPDARAAQDKIYQWEDAGRR